MSDERSSDLPAPQPASRRTDSPGLDRAKLTEQRLQEVLAAYKDLKAENASFRDRAKKNAERRFAERQEQFVLKFMDILDNFDRALDAAQSSYAGNPLIDGLILVRTQILQTLQDEGLEWIPVVGRPYDPEVAEAVATETVDEPERHYVVLKDEMRGYRLNGRLVRAARVVVGKYEGPEAVASAAQDDLTAAVLEAAATTDEEIQGEPEEPIGAEEIPDRHTVANLADAAAEAVSAVAVVEDTKRRMAAVATEEVEAAPARDPSEEFTDAGVEVAAEVTDSGTFQIDDGDEAGAGIADVIRAAAEAVPGDDSASADDEEPAEPPKENADD